MGYQMIPGLTYMGKPTYVEDGVVVAPPPIVTPPVQLLVPAELVGRTAYKQTMPTQSGFRLITPRPLGANEYWQVAFRSASVDNGKGVRFTGAAYRGDQVQRLWKLIRNSDNAVMYEQPARNPSPTFNMVFTYGPQVPYIKNLPLNTDYTLFVWSPSGQVSDCFLDYYN